MNIKDGLSGLITLLIGVILLAIVVSLLLSMFGRQKPEVQTVFVERDRPWLRGAWWGRYGGGLPGWGGGYGKPHPGPPPPGPPPPGPPPPATPPPATPPPA